MTESEASPSRRASDGKAERETPMAFPPGGGACEDDPRPDVQIHTDGACSGNPGPGGWGALMRYGQHEKTLSGYASRTTNNRMEMLAAIRALEVLKRPCRVVLTTDSQYVKNGITKWIHQWKKRRWRKADGGSVANTDLWKRLDDLRCRHDVDWRWIRGHAGHQDNETADELARSAVRRGREGLLDSDPAGLEPGLIR